MSKTSHLPPDRSAIATEARHPGSAQLDTLPTAQLVMLMAADHRAVCQAVERACDSISDLIHAVAAKMQDGGRLIYVGAGTSGRLGVLDASECPPTFQSNPEQVVGIIAGGEAALRRSSEGREDDPSGSEDEFQRLELTSRDTVIGIAAGGTTPYVLGALRIAKNHGSATALMTCARPVQPVADCDHLIVLETGPEVLTGSTRLKAGSATKLALNIISTGVFTRLGKVHGNLMVDLRATNQKLTDRAIRIIREFDATLDRDSAHRLLLEAGGQTKLAIVMRVRSISRPEAERLLARANGNLRAALE
jgi:N-acetylmuramic acid 6-phosphate etherase